MIESVSTRHIEPILREDLRKKMVFLAGPRQCGKTTLANKLVSEIGGAYYSWDVDAHRKLLRESRLDSEAKLWVFDELHKNRHWRNWIKGQFDLHGKQHQILVTGSAKLDLYSRGGDSLQGRYFFHRLHPFTLAETLGVAPAKDSKEFPELSRSAQKNATDTLAELLTLGGFPEPLFSASQRSASRWRLSYGTRLIREDIRQLESLRDLDKLELLYERLPASVGSVLSINSLREDLEVAYETVREWLSVFDRLYVCFRVPPFGPPKVKAVKKEQKLYFWDWGMIEGEAARMENLVALHLLRLQHWIEDVEGVPAELRYFRDVVNHEVDFIFMRNKKPWLAVEVKRSAQNVDSNLKYLLQRVKIPYAFQIHFQGEEDWSPEPINGCKIRVLPAAKFLLGLP